MNNTTTPRSLEMLLTLNNPVFGCYVFWCSVLVIKMLLMSLLTALQRFRFKIPENVDEKVTMSMAQLYANRNAILSASIMRAYDFLCKWYSDFKRVFISPEDEVFARKELVQDNDPHVDRVRRAHLNDMENILPFCAVGLIFVCTDPSATFAMILFRIAGVARILHTLVYAFRPVPQPSRAIAFFAAFFVTIYMGLHVLYNTIKFI